jgi:hypothetical protein
MMLTFLNKIEMKRRYLSSLFFLFCGDNFTLHLVVVSSSERLVVLVFMVIGHLWNNRGQRSEWVEERRRKGKKTREKEKKGGSKSPRPGKKKRTQRKRATRYTTAYFGRSF